MNAPDEQVYLLHFDRKYKHAGHYLGTTRDLDARLTAHREGRGARLLQVLREEGIGWHLVRTWDGGRALERELKGFKNSARLCPECGYLRDRDRPEQVCDRPEPQQQRDSGRAGFGQQSDSGPAWTEPAQVRRVSVPGHAFAGLIRPARDREQEMER